MFNPSHSSSILCLALCVGAAAPARAQIGTAFTYQGALEDGGAPANGNYDMIFNLWDDEFAGSTVGNPSAITFSGATPNGTVTVTGGLFRVTLDFGVTAFDGNPRWLDFAVRAEDPADTEPYFPLDPRVALLPVPYAIRADSAATADDVDDADADPANELQGIDEVLGVGNDAGGADLFGLDELRADNVSSSGNLLRLSGRGGGVNVFMDEDGGSADSFRIYDTGTEVFRVLGNTGQVGINMGVMGLTTTLNLGGTAGVDGIRFPDATVQTTAFTGNVDDADADPANELQDLAGVLGQGNDGGASEMVNIARIGVGTSTPAEAMDLTGNIIVRAIKSPDQSQESSSNGTLIQPDNDAWQSFTAGVTGRLCQVDFRLHGSSLADEVTMEIREGEGPAGNLLSSDVLSLPTGAGQWYEAAILEPPLLAAGNVYSIRWRNITASDLILLGSNADPYAGGTTVFGFFDFAFRTYPGTEGEVTAAAFHGDNALIKSVRFGGTGQYHPSGLDRASTTVAGKVASDGTKSTTPITTSAWFTSTRTGNGRYTVSIPAGVFSSVPIVTITAFDTGGSNNRFAVINAINESTGAYDILVNIQNDNGNPADASFNFIAVGER